MAEQLRGIANLWLNGTLIRNGVQYLVRFENLRAQLGLEVLFRASQPTTPSSVPCSL
jgi:hypothetical protein